MIDEDAVEYFAHKTGFATEGLFESLEADQLVSFRTSETSKGMRAFDIREVAQAEKDSVIEAIDQIIDRQAAQRAQALPAEKGRKGGSRGRTEEAGE